MMTQGLVGGVLSLFAVWQRQKALVIVFLILPVANQRKRWSQLQIHSSTSLILWLHISF